MYAFWRLFDVVKGKLVRKQKEQFIALSGTGWPRHAKYVKGCQKHEEYCKRTLLAYMPYPGLQGTSYTVAAVQAHFKKSWPRALWNFVMDQRTDGVRRGSFAISRCTTIAFMACHICPRCQPPSLKSRQKVRTTKAPFPMRGSIRSSSNLNAAANPTQKIP